jgi:hypothetical protein
MRPRRTSVALWTEGKLRAFVEAAMEGIINSRWSFVASNRIPKRVTLGPVGSACAQSLDKAPQSCPSFFRYERVELTAAPSDCF